MTGRPRHYRRLQCHRRGPASITVCILVSTNLCLVDLDTEVRSDVFSPEGNRVPASSREAQVVRPMQLVGTCFWKLEPFLQVHRVLESVSRLYRHLAGKAIGTKYPIGDLRDRLAIPICGKRKNRFYRLFHRDRSA